LLASGFPPVKHAPIVPELHLGKKAKKTVKYFFSLEV